MATPRKKVEEIETRPSIALGGKSYVIEETFTMGDIEFIEDAFDGTSFDDLISNPTYKFMIHLAYVILKKEKEDLTLDDVRAMKAKLVMNEAAPLDL